MSRNLEDFLKQAARKRQQGAVPPAPSRLLEQDDIQIIDAEVISDPVSGDDVAAHVSRHLDSSRFSRRAAQMGEGIDQTDERVEAHLHQVFDHGLGRLKAEARPAVEEKKQFNIQDLLRSSENIRNAVILSEILNPPKDRW